MLSFLLSQLNATSLRNVLKGQGEASLAAAGSSRWRKSGWDQILEDLVCQAGIINFSGL